VCRRDVQKTDATGNAAAADLAVSHNSVADFVRSPLLIAGMALGASVVFWRREGGQRRHAGSMAEVY